MYLLPHETPHPYPSHYRRGEKPVGRGPALLECLYRPVSQDAAGQRSGEVAPRIAAFTGSTDQTVRNAIKAFHRRGWRPYKPAPPGPKSARPVFSGARLKELLRQSPRAYGKASSRWTLPLVAEVAFEEGISPVQLSGESVRRAFRRPRINWKRAKRWISSPDPASGVK